MNRLLPFLLIALLAACGEAEQSASSEPRDETLVEHATKHMDPTYVCPMHPEVTSDEPGECPICGMTLVKREPAAGQASEREVLYYRHPHNPEVTSPVPTKDEMGMDFIPVYSSGAGGEVVLAPGMVQTLGVRTAVVEHGRLWRRIDTVGYVRFNEALLRHIHPRAAGWVRDLAVRSAGERVTEGEVLFTFYSPDIVNAQEEFISALNTGNQRLVNASRERLIALDVAERDIAQLEKTRKVIREIPYYAPRDEVVAELNVREGMYVTPGMEAMSLADLSSVWVVADVFAAQSEWLREGQPAAVQLEYLPGREWEGRVDFVSPVLDPKTRTVQARLKFDNPGEQLKPNMFADVAIYGGPKEGVTFVPREALIRTDDGGRVILALGEGRFAVREVVPGMESGGYVEIREGLQAGECVVTSGQFLIDSEASLQASLRRLESDERTQEEPADAHEGHGMEDMQ